MDKVASTNSTSGWDTTQKRLLAKALKRQYQMSQAT